MHNHFCSWTGYEQSTNTELFTVNVPKDTPYHIFCIKQFIHKTKVLKNLHKILYCTRNLTGWFELHINKNSGVLEHPFSSWPYACTFPNQAKTTDFKTNNSNIHQICHQTWPKQLALSSWLCFTMTFAEHHRINNWCICYQCKCSPPSNISQII